MHAALRAAIRHSSGGGGGGGGTGSYRGFGASTQSIGGANVTPSISSFNPANPVSGDFIVAACLMQDSDGDTPLGIASGFSDYPGATSGVAPWPAVVAKLQVGTQSGSFSTLTWPQETDFPIDVVCFSFAFSGIAGARDLTGDTNNASLTSPSVTPGASTDILVSIIAGAKTTGSAPSAFTAPSGMTLIGSATTGGSPEAWRIWVAAAYQQLSSTSATGTKVWTGTGLTSGSTDASSLLLHV